MTTPGRLAGEPLIARLTRSCSVHARSHAAARRGSGSVTLAAASAWATGSRCPVARAASSAAPLAEKSA